MTDFNDVAYKPPMSVAEADLAIQKFYGRIRGENDLDVKAEIAKEMVNSDALRILSEGAPWQAANLLHASLEYLPASEAFKTIYSTLANITKLNLEPIYRQAAEWLLEDADRLEKNVHAEFDVLGERLDKDRNRFAWQQLRRNVLASYKDLSDEGKLAVLEKTLASARLLAEVITPSRPWEALDILSTFVEICPDRFKAEFAQKYFFESQALRLVSGQCDKMAQAFSEKVEGFLLKTPEATATPAGPTGPAKNQP